MNAEEKKAPFVSVVVISKDRHDDLEKAVGSLRRLDYPCNRYEIVVVEEGDTERPLGGARYVFLPRLDLGLGYARNIGVGNSKGDIIAFTDDDCIVDAGWLKEIVAAFDDHEVAGVAGATFIQEGSLLGMCEDILGFPGGGHNRYHRSKGRTVETELLSGCNCSYRREVFDKLSFKEDGYGRLGADDCLFGLMVARERKCLYVPVAVVYHKPRGSLGKIVSWFSRRRINELLFQEADDDRKNYGTILRTPHRTILFRAILALALPVFFGRAGIGVLLLAAAGWYLFILVRNFPVTRYFNTRWVILLVPIVRLFMDFGVMLGEWRYLTQNHEKLSLALAEYKR